MFYDKITKQNETVTRKKAWECHQNGGIKLSEFVQVPNKLGTFKGQNLLFRYKGSKKELTFDFVHTNVSFVQKRFI